MVETVKGAVESTIRILNQALPILLLIVVGYWIRQRCHSFCF